MPTGFRYENMKKRGYVEDLTVGGKLTRKGSYKWTGRDWSDLV
jgi:hypothetical protein